MADSMKHKARRGSYSMLISFAADTCGPAVVVSRRLLATATEVTSSGSSLACTRARKTGTTGPIRRKQIKNVHAEYVPSERF